jgi:hypothetical protein
MDGLDAGQHFDPVFAGQHYVQQDHRGTESGAQKLKRLIAGSAAVYGIPGCTKKRRQIVSSTFIVVYDQN